MKISKLVFFTLSLTLLSCVSNHSKHSEIYTKVTSISLSELQKAINDKKVIEIIDALKEAKPLKMHEIDVQINASSSELVEIKGRKYLSVAYSINESEFKSLQISSYIVPVKNSPDYLFFPVISQFDSEYRLIETTYASEDFLITEGALRTSYVVAPSTSYILFHTDERYLSIGSIDGEQGGLSPTGNYSSVDINGAVVVASILGGAIGGALAGGLISTSFEYESAPPENFYFGSGGIFDIHTTK